METIHNTSDTNLIFNNAEICLFTLTPKNNSVWLGFNYCDSNNSSLIDHRNLYLELNLHGVKFINTFFNWFDCNNHRISIEYQPNRVYRITACHRFGIEIFDMEVKSLSASDSRTAENIPYNHSEELEMDGGRINAIYVNELRINCGYIELAIEIDQTSNTSFPIKRNRIEHNIIHLKFQILCYLAMNLNLLNNGRLFFSFSKDQFKKIHAEGKTESGVCVLAFIAENMETYNVDI